MKNLDQIQIWKFNLIVGNSELQELKALLTDDENTRAARFRFEVHRRRFIVARANLRLVLSEYLREYLSEYLSEYLDISAAKIEFAYSAHGKPFLVRQNQINPDQNLEFNLSHSQDLAMCAITRNDAVGIDLEYLRSGDESQIKFGSENPKKSNRILNLAKRFLHTDEVKIIQTSPTPEETFLKIWTAKEAYLKATGSGLGKLSEVSTIWGKDAEKDKIIDLCVNQIPLNWQIYQFCEHDSFGKKFIATVASSVFKPVEFKN